LRSENFVAFFTICGFFIGLIFSLVKFEDPAEFVYYTLAITLFFYLFIHMVLIFFLKSQDITAQVLDKEQFETFVNTQIAEIQEREERITAIIRSIHEINTNQKEGV